MIAAVASITLRALFNRRRTVLLLLLGALLVLISVLFRLGDPGEAESTEVTRRLLADFGIAVLLPLVAVIIGTSALGSEIEDGTIVYLLAKPVPRSWIVLIKLVVAWLVTVALVAPALGVAGLIGGDGQLAAAHAVAAVVGALEYTAIFIALSLVTSRALIAGLAYVVVWEGVVAGLFSGTRILSVRQHVLAVAEALGGPGAADSAELALGVALAMAAVATVAAVTLAIRRLATVELRGET
ncbi:MAG TPA: ABC transporter permease subunit [Candidatus Binatia bacterium]|nr:ABC transporter permease subunit [Candidatus Binatia bacterium]